jgi:putative tryptophan/tyrosine transport system substrate-binding protein
MAGSAVLTGCGWHRFTPTPPEVPAVGVLSGYSQNQAHEITDPFQQGLAELSYDEGRNIALELRFTEGRGERLPSLARELVAHPVRAIFAPDTPAALATRAATASIPVIMACGDPVALGLVDSLARPSGNVTGLSFASVLLAGKRLELLKQVAPARSSTKTCSPSPSRGRGG